MEGNSSRYNGTQLSNQYTDLQGVKILICGKTVMDSHERRKYLHRPGFFSILVMSPLIKSSARLRGTATKDWKVPP